MENIDEVLTGQLPGSIYPKLIKLGHLIIDPFEEKSLQNICYYLHLGNRFRQPKEGAEPINPLSRASIEEAFEPIVPM